MAKKKLVKLDIGTEHTVRIPADFRHVDFINGIAPDSVDEAQSIGYVQRLSVEHRYAFFNDLFYVLKPGAKCLIAVPYWASGAAYGDLRAQWPPISEHFFAYLNAGWREANGVTDLRWTCDFDHTLGYGLSPHVATRNQEYQQFAVAFYKEAAQDLIATLVKR
jgi:hypothetical protein